MLRFGDSGVEEMKRALINKGDIDVKNTLRRLVLYPVELRPQCFFAVFASLASAVTWRTNFCVDSSYIW